MNRPNITIVAQSGQQLFGAAQIRDVVFSTGEHGSESLQATVALSAKLAVQALDRLGVPDVYVSANGATVWRGRLEDAQIVDGGLQITAYGYWRSLSDVPYTALWSDTNTQEWRPILTTEMTDRYQSRWTYDTQNRIFITANTGDTFGNSPYIVGSMYYSVPSGSSRNITHASFDFSCDFAGTWVVGLERLDASFTSLSQPWTRSTTGTGTQSLSFTSCHGLNFFMYYNGSNAVNTAETGRNYLRITNLRIKTSSTVTPTDIATDLIASGAQLDTSTALIGSNTIDLQNELYEDAYPADILTRLAGLGDASGNRWEAGVDNNKRLYYRQVGTGAREWYLNAESIQLQRSLSDLRNSVYAVYENASGQAIRGTTSTDATSTARYGVTRRAALGVDTTNSTQANYHRDVYLNDNKDLTPRAAFRVRSIYGLGTSPAPAFLVKAGDYVTVNNLPPSPDAALNKARRFRVTRTEYDCETGELTIEPESPLPTLDFLVAREAVGIGPRYRHNNPAMGRIRRS